MKNIQLFETKVQAVGLEVETPYVASIDEQTQPVYGDSSLGEKVTLIKDANDIVVCAIKELEDEGYVDLGLPSGKLWASCNLGASSPCEYGNLYAWGETEPKTDYSWSTYKYGTSTDNITKYNSTDGLTTLESSDDAVYVATNGEAHMPTIADIQELLDNTNNTWCTCAVGLGEGHDGHTIDGRLFTSKTDSTKKIFIPHSGYNGAYEYPAGYGFFVWSSSLSDENLWQAWSLGSISSAVDIFKRGDRCYNYSVRGVKDHS